jgi:hypothetical protein
LFELEEDSRDGRSNLMKRCIVMGCTNTSDEGAFIGDLCAPCHRFVASGEGIHSQAYRNARWLMRRVMMLELEPLPEGNAERRELCCLFCGMTGCDHKISLWEWAPESRHVGVHESCIDRHEAMVAKLKKLGI